MKQQISFMHQVVFMMIWKEGLARNEACVTKEIEDKVCQIFKKDPRTFIMHLAQKQAFCSLTYRIVCEDMDPFPYKVQVL